MPQPRTEVPAEFRAPDGRLPSQASARQVEYIVDLLNKRRLSADEQARANEMLREGLTKPQASKWIDRLRSLPSRSEPSQRRPPAQSRNVPLPDVPAGRYAVEEDDVLKFFLVDKPETGQWAGWTFLKIQASDDLYKVKDFDRKRRIITEIAIDPKAASLLYGKEIGRCGVCGRTLTDKTSRERGIGPVCANRMDW